jgi:predicted RecA/RadA family phage recombinase
MKNFVQIGDNLTFVESELTHPSHSDNLVNSGDPVVVGRVIGVANQDAAATTDNIVVSTRGVFNISVTAKAGFAIVKGESVHIDASTAVVSNDATDIPFGVCLDTVAQGTTKTIPVKLFGATPGDLGTGIS